MRKKRREKTRNGEVMIGANESERRGLRGSIVYIANRPREYLSRRAEYAVYVRRCVGPCLMCVRRDSWREEDR